MTRSCTRVHARRLNILKLAAVSASVAMFVASGSPLLAAGFTYTPANTTTDVWSAGTNWSAVPVSAPDTQLTFVGSNATVLADGLANTNTNDIGPFQLNILDLQGTGPTTTAATITIASASGSSLNFITNPTGSVAPVANLNALTSTPGLTYNVTSDVTLTNTTTFQGNGTATFNFSGAVNSTGAGLTKSGTSTLILSGANGYTGATLISAGALNIRTASALGSNVAGTTISAGAALQLQGGILISGEALTMSGDGVPATQGALRNISGANEWTGNITVAAAPTSRIASDGGSLTISGNVALSATTGDQFVLQGAGSGTISGIISGPSRVTRGLNGSGTWTLSGANTYTGRTVVSGGSLSAASLNKVVGGAASSNLGAPTTVANGTWDPLESTCRHASLSIL